MFFEEVLVKFVLEELVVEVVGEMEKINKIKKWRLLKIKWCLMSLEFEEVIDEKDVVERIVMLSKELEIGVVIEVIELIIKKEVSML